MVTIYDIAKECNCAASTVSKALNNYKGINKNTKDFILNTAKKMNYLPNSMARSIKLKRSSNVGVLIYIEDHFPSLKHTFFLSILESFKRVLERENYDLTIISQYIGESENSFLDHCKIRQVDGVIIFGDYSNKKVIDLINSNIPVVGFDYIGNNINGVTSDNYEKMYELTKYIISLNHNKIIYIKGEINDVTKLRIKGFQDALIDAGIEVKEDMIINGKYYAYNDMFELTKKLLLSENRPTAIIYPDDYAAFGGLSAAYECGLNVPKDLSIAGFDGIDMAEMIRPKLTTIKQDTQLIGKKLAETLFNLMKNNDVKPELLVVQSTLIKGETCSKI